MKKRLRKKRRLGEFREDCFELTFEMSPALSNDDIDSLTDTFIDMIESNGLQFGGGGNSLWSGIVQGPCRGAATESDRRAVLDWLNQQPDVLNTQAGPLRDASYGWSS
ncbi:50S ribosome-binding protein YggL [Novipirellula caenicola]